MHYALHLVEPEALSNLIPANDPKVHRHQLIQVLVLSWIVSELRILNRDAPPPMEIHVVRAEYLGVYPCIAVRYLDLAGCVNNDSDDEIRRINAMIEERIELQVKRILDNASAKDLIHFAISPEKSWPDIHHELFELLPGEHPRSHLRRVSDDILSKS
ncbi:MAG: hypothetical protein KF774_21630 [Planctomyces sp.]|nr:hypothetical protein [Planctomyces sp.]